jgi:hypothetical protein
MSISAASVDARTVAGVDDCRSTDVVFSMADRIFFWLR